MGALCIVKSQEDFNKYIIEEMTKIVYRIQEINKEVDNLKKCNINYDFWFNNYKKEMELDKNDKI